MINQKLRLKGRELFEERLKFGKRYVRYPTDHEAIAHALMDGHTHLIRCSNTSPRFFFTATQGHSGKSTATQVSWFFVQNPILVQAAEAGLIRKVNEIIQLEQPLPTILYDEAQEVYGPKGNYTIAALFSSYTRGIPKTITGEDGKSVDYELFCPVIMNGMTTKYDIPANFLERCIETQLFKILPNEPVEDLDFSELMEDIGHSHREPRADWAANFSKQEIKDNRPTITEHLEKHGIRTRDMQLWRPLVEYAFLCGDDTFETAMAAAKHYVLDEPIMKKLSDNEKLLDDIWEVFNETKEPFLNSNALATGLREIVDAQWNNYRHNGLTPNNIATLLRPYGIHSDKNVTSTKRGYYVSQFVDTWKRVLGKDIPTSSKDNNNNIEEMDSIDGMDRICEDGVGQVTSYSDCSTVEPAHRGVVYKKLKDGNWELVP